MDRTRLTSSANQQQGAVNAATQTYRAVGGLDPATTTGTLHVQEQTAAATRRRGNVQNECKELQ